MRSNNARSRGMGDHGRLSVQQQTGLAAQKARVARLIGVMSAPADTLPLKANRFAKADLVSARRKAGER